MVDEGELLLRERDRDRPQVVLELLNAFGADQHGRDRFLSEQSGQGSLGDRDPVGVRHAPQDIDRVKAAPVVDVRPTLRKPAFLGDRGAACRST